MSLNVARSDGVTVLTLTSDPSRTCPPLCQLLGALCYTPGLCSTSRRLTLPWRGAQAGLGAVWILTGILHIGLSLVLIKYSPEPEFYFLRCTKFPVWVGALFLVFGLSCILTERHPRALWVLLNGLVNVTGVALSIFAIVGYSIGLDVRFIHFCPEYELDALHRRCEDSWYLLRVLTVGVTTALMTLSVLDVGLGLSSAALSFKALKQGTIESRNGPLPEEVEAELPKTKRQTPAFPTVQS